MSIEHGITVIELGRLREDFEVWLATRPESVHAVARRYPPGTKFLSRIGTVFYVVSYTEDGGIRVSETDPCEDYAKAVATRREVCRDCLQKLMSQ